MEILLSDGADPNIPNKVCRHTLHRLIYTANRLLRYFKDGCTPLHELGFEPNSVWVELLLSHEADPNIKERVSN